MARPLYASFLPTIKCSNCGAEIEISAMGDHLCTGAPDALPQVERSDHDRIPAPYLQPPGRLGAPGPFGRPAQLPSIPNSHQRAGLGLRPLDMRVSPAPSPVATPPATESVPTTMNSSVSSGLSAPHRAVPARSATEPAFPVTGSSSLQAPQHNNLLPNSQSAASLVRPNAPTHISLPSDDRSNSSSGLNSPHGPLSPAVNSGANVVKRMNSITPGPFNARSRSIGDNSAPLSPRYGAVGRTSSSDLRTTPSPSGQILQQPPRPDSDASFNGPLGNPSEAPLKPTMAVLPETETKLETRLDDPEAKTTTSPDRIADEPEGETVAPLPQFSQSNRGHSLSGSESSTASRSASDSRTASTASSQSPVISNTSSATNFKVPVEQGSFGGQKGEPMSSSDQATEAVSEAHGAIKPSQARSSTSPVVMRSAQSSYSEYSMARDSASKTPVSQDQTDGVQRLSSLRYDPSVTNGRASGPAVSPPRPVEPKRRVVTPKGKCRGCELPITGKSIKAADGRLSGRWHRECFMCQTCKAQFQTADFYVLNDQPYCAHHYHALNGSLCTKCDKGIEGKYVETQPLKRYHQDCFACHDCRKPLTKDYFEMNNQFYCEADAFRVWQKSKALTPGRRFPERRTTRLMTMASARP